jgi:hypothetical protein
MSKDSGEAGAHIMIGCFIISMGLAAMATAFLLVVWLARHAFA